MAPQLTNTQEPVSAMRRDTGNEPAVGEVCLVSTTEHRYFQDPVSIYSTHDPGQVKNLLETIDERVRSESLYAVGYLAYEASSAFDSALVTHPAGPEPILWFGLYEKFKSALPKQSPRNVDTPIWKSSLSQEGFDSAISQIRDYIAAGDTYQVNHTFPLYAEFTGDAYAWFRHLCDAQSADYCAYINTGTHVILSVSPELFFRLDGVRLTTRPMKGTIARGPTVESDAAQRQKLLDSQKDRAENIMIVDLLRNDMGRISKTGSVHVESRFDIHKYDTLWQMTSTITSETRANVAEIFKALFPSGSVTGTPKIRTSEIIRELESAPRGAYCGAIGWWGPDRRAEFNVAIRTAILDIENNQMRYPVGAAITWDSSSDAEYAECLLKAEVVSQTQPTFELLESILWDGTYFLLERHIDRLRQSADYFSFNVDESRVLEKLTDIENDFGSAPQKVRLLLSRNGEIHVEYAPVTPSPTSDVMIAPEATCEEDVFLYHKTTNRSVYETALEKVDTADVILWNTRGEITESTRANVVIKRNGKWITPPVTSGLLAGTYRAQLLEEGTIEEGVVLKEELVSAEEVCLINSVRRWIPVNIVSSDAMEIS